MVAAVIAMRLERNLKPMTYERMRWSNISSERATSVSPSFIFVEEHDFYEFGHFRLKPAARSLTNRRDESHVLLSPKSFDLLLLLVQNKNCLVTKEMIFEQIWGGRVVEENNLTVRISEMRKALGEEKRGSEKFIETISGSGYRFICEVRSSNNESLSHLKSPDQTLFSIAVLPFVNESGTDEFKYLADGITECVINNLSHLPQIKVISRNTAFRFRGDEADFRQIGDRLGVRTILTGRVVQVGEIFISSIELIDCADNSQIWGTRYKHQSKDFFDAQETIAKEVVDGLQVKLTGNLAI